jgi:SAM-dependent methyltransferase
VAGVKLNLGSGERPLEGFVNVDALENLPGVDVVADISQRLPFDDGSADLVHASHILEHFSTEDVPRLLHEWRRVLSGGGRLFVAVPDLDVIAHRLVQLRGWFTPPNNPWLGAIYGGQKDEYDFHKTGFTAPWLAGLLNDAGFGAIKRVERFPGIDRPDASYSPLPFGENLSLNMVAVAGVDGPDPSLFERTSIERAFDLADRLLERGMWVSTQARGSILNRRRRRLERALG